MNKICFALFCFILFCMIFFLILYLQGNKLQYTSIENSKDIENKIDLYDNQHNNQIKIYFPMTTYPKLNKKLEHIVSSTVNEFKKNLPPQNIQPFILYTLYGHYDLYHYQNIISVVFFFEMYTGGAHSIYITQTVNFDTRTNQFITIDDLIQKNPEILSILSKESKQLLQKNPKLKNNIDQSMFHSGTLPIKENYQNFVFTENGLLLFFEHYQIAPFYLGDFKIIIPYEKLF